MSVTLLRDLARPWPSPIVQRIVPLDNPPAGGEVLYVVPGDKLWYPVALVARLDTSGAGANRFAELQVTDGTSIAYSYAGFFASAPSTTQLGSWIEGVTGPSQSPGPALTTQQLPSVVLQPGWTLGTHTDGLDVGDQWNAITLTVLEVFSGAVEHERQNENMIRDHLDALATLTTQAGLS